MKENNEENQGKHSVAWEDMKDSDEDGLPDIYESEIGTDSKKADTDEDSLPDGFEVLDANTDPLNSNTLGNELTDNLLNPDEDGLTMFEEYKLQTDPLEKDSDNDEISDGEEVKVYLTDPLNYDTDGDGIGDGEEIRLGLDPLNASTHGNPDSQYQSTQTLNNDASILESINKENNDYQLSMDITAMGSVSDNLFVRESAFTNVIESISTIGSIPEIIYDNPTALESMTLKFKISDDKLYEDFSSVDLKGIKRYNIFQYDEELGFLLPVDTKFNEEEKTIYAQVDEAGTYCVMDLEKWFSSMGIELDSAPLQKRVQNKSSEEVLEIKPGNDGIAATSAALNVNQEIFKYKKGSVSILTKTVANLADYNKEVIDLVILLNTAVNGLTKEDFDNIKYNINEIGKRAFYESKSVRIRIIDPNGNIITTKFGQEYATNTLQLNTMIEKMLNGPPITPYLNTQFNTLLNEVEFQKNSTRVAVVIGNAYINNESLLLPGKLSAANIHTCVVEPRTQTGSLYYSMADATSGRLVFDFFDFTDDITEYLYNYIPSVPNNSFITLTATGLKTILLKEDLASESKVDTDNDGIPDWEEINQAYVTVADDGRILLPTLSKYMMEYGLKKPYLLTAFVRLSNTWTTDGVPIAEKLNDIHILPIISDPTSIDGDSDGILDKEEVKWDGVDERYKYVDPLHKDTIEMFFHELKNNELKNSKNAPSYLEIEDNDVTLHLRIMLNEEGGNSAATSLSTTYSSDENEIVSKEIISRLGSSHTFKDIVFDGIKQRWGGSYKGNEYDFYRGLNVNFKVEIEEQTTKKWLEKIIKVNVKNGVCGVSNQSGVNWKSNCNRVITMYSSYCGDESHQNKDGKDCTNYQDSLYTIADYEGTIAHEFGHVIGLKDMYRGARNHSVIKIVHQELIIFGTRKTSFINNFTNK